MAREPNRKAIGAFIFIGILLLTAMLLMFFGHKLFSSEKDMQVMYFEGSVKGLNVGSPVMLRGVQVGRVERMEMIADVNTYNFVISVYTSIDPTKFSIVGASSTKERSVRDQRRFLKALVTRGLCAQLVTQSVVTGQSMIALDIQPNAKASARGVVKDNNIIEIPTIPSAMDELTKRLQDLPLQDIATQFNLLLVNLNKDIPSLVKEMSTMTHQLNTVLADIHGFSSSSSDLNQMIKDFSAMARSMKDFADYLERHPEALLKGKNNP